MRSHVKRTKHQVEESPFMSMTDMTVSFLFIILILLAYFMTQIQTEETVPKQNYDVVVAKVEDLEKEIERLKKLLAQNTALSKYVNAVSIEKQAIMKKIRDKLLERLPGLQLEIDWTNGVIRLRGDDLFQPGKWRISAGSRTETIAKAIADALDEILPCFSTGPLSNFNVSCNPNDALFSTIQIEGHTDDIGISKTLRAREHIEDNFDLSARRGAETFRAMVERHIPSLTEYKNQSGQPILSFSGYGSMRPLVKDDSESARQANRRIDIRFIMGSPRDLKGMDDIRDALRASGAKTE